MKIYHLVFKKSYEKRKERKENFLGKQLKNLEENWFSNKPVLSRLQTETWKNLNQKKINDIRVRSLM